MFKNRASIFFYDVPITTYLTTVVVSHPRTKHIKSSFPNHVQICFKKNYAQKEKFFFREPKKEKLEFSLCSKISLSQVHLYVEQSGSFPRLLVQWSTRLYRSDCFEELSVLGTTSNLTLLDARQRRCVFPDTNCCMPSTVLPLCPFRRPVQHLPPSNCTPI